MDAFTELEDYKSKVLKDLQKNLAGGLGFEPRFSDPKSDVLPLDDPPTGVHDKA